MEWMGRFQTIVVDRPLLALVVAFGGGVVAGFTPCVYPMIPITVAFIGGRAKGSKWRGFVLSSIYVLGVAVVYSALGAFAALTGRFFGTWASSPWANLIVAALCILFGLTMLDMTPIFYPAFLSRLRVSRLPGSDAVTSFLMGGASALVVSSCTTPILGVLLTLVATRQRVLWGMAMLFVFAYGMGTLFIVVGTFAGLLSSMPRSGTWMNRIQKFFGASMVLIGIYFLVKAGEVWLL